MCNREKNNVKYYQSQSEDIEVVYCKKSNISYPQHNHIATFVLGLVLDGSFELIKNDEHIVCTAGNIFTISPYEPHAILYKQEKYTVVTICFSEKIINECSIDTILVRVSTTLDSLKNKGIISQQQQIMLVDNVLFINEYYSENNLLDDSAINKAKIILEKKPEKQMEIENLSKQVCVSKYHFIRKFKKNIGLTPHYFQMQNRIRKSQQLLSKGETITKVALEVGFYDQSHFIKWFKRILGITPSEYIQSCEKIPDNKYN